MKKQFINKWFCWWCLDLQKDKLNIAFEQELNNVIKQEFINFIDDLKEKNIYCGVLSFERETKELIKKYLNK